MADATVLEDTFSITTVDQKKYDRVSRIHGTSIDNTITMQLDINHELFPVAVGDQLQFNLATTLNLDGTKDERGWRGLRPDQATLADMYDYVCHGKVYRFEDSAEAENAKVFVSFGGLLLYIEGPYKKLTGLRIEYVYLLLKK